MWGRERWGGRGWAQEAGIQLGHPRQPEGQVRHANGRCQLITVPSGPVISSFSAPGHIVVSPLFSAYAQVVLINNQGSALQRSP